MLLHICCRAETEVLSKTYHKTLAKVGPQTISIVEPTPNVPLLPHTLTRFWNSAASWRYSVQPHSKHWVTLAYPAKLLSAGERKEQDFQRTWVLYCVELRLSKGLSTWLHPCSLLSSKYNLYSLASACCSLGGLCPAFLHLANSHSFQQLKPKPYLLWEAFSDFPSSGLLCIK